MTENNMNGCSFEVEVDDADDQFKNIIKELIYDGCFKQGFIDWAEKHTNFIYSKTTNMFYLSFPDCRIFIKEMVKYNASNEIPDNFIYYMIDGLSLSIIDYIEHTGTKLERDEDDHIINSNMDYLLINMYNFAKYNFNITIGYE
jgi:hypothetical protein